MTGLARGRRPAAVALAFAIVAVAAAPASAGATAVGDRAGAGGLAQQGTPTNGTVRHEDPDAVSGGGDLRALERQLASRLRERLGEGTVSIDRGQYEAARAALGDGYDAQLDRYVEVAGETGDEEAAESFREAGERTRSFANRTAAFEATYREYRRARERGDADRARTLARTLVERARALNRTGERVQDAYAFVGNRTGGDLAASSERVETVRRNASERADAVAEATFTRTRLSAAANRSTVSFRQSVTVRGRLVDENGTALPGRTVLVGAASEAVPAVTNETGRFEATYRPVRLQVEPGEVPVRYVPANESEYLGNRTSVSVTVRPVRPTLTARVNRSGAAYGDGVAVRGSTWAGDQQISGVPLVVTVGGVRLDRVRTGPFGWYVATGRLPAAVEPGNRSVDVRLAMEGRSIRTASATDSLTVRSTGTTIELDGTPEADGTLVVRGRLRTADGRGIGGRTVSLAAGGTAVRTVETDDSGRFMARIGPTAYAAGDDGNVTATAAFDGSGSNLGDARTSVALAVPRAESGGSAGGPSGWMWVVVAVALVVVGGFVALRLRGQVAEAGDEPDGGRGSSAAGIDGGGTSGHGIWRDEVESLLEAGETDRAVARAYEAARGRMAAELGSAGALTHWEFYAAAADDGVTADRVEALLGLTEAYERARFAPAAVSAEDAAAAVERAATAVG